MRDSMRRGRIVKVYAEFLRCIKSCSYALELVCYESMHLELVTALTTEAFLTALRWQEEVFVCVRNYNATL